MTAAAAAGSGGGSHHPTVPMDKAVSDYVAAHPESRSSTGTIRVRTDAAGSIPDDDFRALARAVLTGG